MGFSVKLVDWSKWCISTPQFSVLVTGRLAGYFKSFRGVRQGLTILVFFCPGNGNVVHATR